MHFRVHTILLISLMLLSYCGTRKQSVDKVSGSPQQVKYWTDFDKTTNPTIGCPGRLFPLSYRMLETDYEGLRKLLLYRNGPSSKDTITLAVPLPDGSWENFAITRVQVMAPDLAEKFPEIGTYSGTSLLYPADNIRIDISPKGISMMILSSRGTIIMDPLCDFDSPYVISYFKKNLPGDAKPIFEK